MPPYYPDEYQNQYSNQYPYGASYNDQYNQYQYASAPNPQRIPPFSQLQVNVPSRQQQTSAQPQLQQQPQPQYNYHQNLQQNYAPAAVQYQFQYQPQPSYPPQYEHPSPLQHQIQSQQYYQPMPQYTVPSHQIQVNVPKVQAQPSPNQRILKDVQPTAPRQQPSTASKPPPPKKEVEPPEPDYEILLLSLADEYLEAAQKLPLRSEGYFKLTATALGCIDAVLNNFKLSSIREAQVSLRYAQLLFSETENHDDAERILTKTIDMCDRLKYHDLKYGAQLLLTRVLYQSRPKAALKDLQGMIQDIEAYKHVAWEYAFRIQYVMFAASSNQPNDTQIVIGQLERVCHVARQHGDHAILAFASVLEALIHLQTTGAESVQSSQQSLAKARSLQMNPAVEENPQLCLMMEFVDLCGQIKNLDVKQSDQKRKAMQAVLYPALQKPSWRNDGLMYLPVNHASLRGLQTQEGGLIVEKNGRHFLAFSWLPKDEVEDLGYLLSGISAAHNNAGDGGKAEKFFGEGLAMVNEIMDERQSLNCAGDAVRIRQELVKCHFLLEMAFLQCSKGQWAKAQASLKNIDNAAQKVDNLFPVELRSLTIYLKGAVHQGRGELDTALNIFQSRSFAITPQIDSQGTAKPSSHLHKRDEIIQTISLLAAMNTIFIIQQPHHPQHSKLSGLLSTVDSLASGHSNKNIQAAWNFVLASLPNNTILKTKQYLGNALNAAQSIHNAQITTLCLVTMQEKFFKGVVGDQAMKCARAAGHQARRLNEPMWVAAASGLEAECLAVHGMVEESKKKQEEVEMALRVLPERVRNHSMAP